MSAKSRIRIDPSMKLPESGEDLERRKGRKLERRARRAARREAVFGKGVA